MRRSLLVPAAILSAILLLAARRLWPSDPLSEAEILVIVASATGLVAAAARAPNWWARLKYQKAPAVPRRRGKKVRRNG